MMKLTPWILGALLALQAGAALAWGGPPPDGAFAEARAAAFEEADANDDGALTLEEFRTLMAMREQRHFERLDADDNGRVTLEELEEGRGKRGRRARRRGPR